MLTFVRGWMLPDAETTEMISPPSAFATKNPVPDFLCDFIQPAVIMAPRTTTPRRMRRTFFFMCGPLSGGCEGPGDGHEPDQSIGNPDCERALRAAPVRGGGDPDAKDDEPPDRKDVDHRKQRVQRAAD